MNRVIKFRAWDGASMRYAVTVFEHGNKNGVFLDGDFYLIDEVNHSASSMSLHHSASVMQYTGLTDKNGVEIYEFDVVSNSIWTCNLTVIYDDLLACWFLADADGYLEMLSDYHSESIIIGNIHQNPELLK